MNVVLPPRLPLRRKEPLIALATESAPFLPAGAFRPRAVDYPAPLGGGGGAGNALEKSQSFSV